jgi:acyl carrier protein phosphodiesterase
MNLLAHLHLSDGLPVGTAAGNLLADYLRRLNAVPLDADFAAGVRLHRAIDAYADSHPAVRAARAAFEPPWRRPGGILIDVACDFFLTQDWPRHSPVPLREYVAGRLGEIRRYARGHRTPLSPLLDRAIAEEWLLEYGTPDGLRRTFERIARRSPAAAILRGAEREIERRRDQLWAAFDEFYPQLLARFAPARPPASPPA